jgi:hypothetical protein
MEQISIYGITHRHTWPRYKDDIVRVILEALTILKERDDLIADEVDLNRKLFFCFKRAALKLKLSYSIFAQFGRSRVRRQKGHRRHQVECQREIADEATEGPSDDGDAGSHGEPRQG